MSALEVLAAKAPRARHRLSDAICICAQEGGRKKRKAEDADSSGVSDKAMKWVRTPTHMWS